MILVNMKETNIIAQCFLRMLIQMIFVVEQKGEPMSKLYQNKWAGHETYFTPIYPVRTRKGEADAIGGYEITKINGKWQCRKGQYYTHSLRDEEHFPVVGNVKINILGYVMGEMLDALERRTDE